MINILYSLGLGLVSYLATHFVTKFYYKFYKKELSKTDIKYCRSWLSISELMGFGFYLLSVAIGFWVFKNLGF
jgi:hypothetical protein